ncbi:MAG: TonB-dependent receptor [Bacteroidetes bacterium]|jgi:iron complex outermembrane recepter protein|nr:TonB-dependent receptor [Bacteroidota bacterium]MBT6687146.1 TonB-dependent receptor [Bacteroidota bacterium]MBT7144919.1 TonB-dependent receptor [Bacteroidota bacterium]MBT7492162.1 TonB-dependent receptor [Bacteroidota bacterium]
MKKYLIILLLLNISIVLNAEKVELSGVIRDAVTQETLIGASVLIKKGVGTVTDLDGKYSIELESGEYDLQISYVGYKTLLKHLLVKEKSIFLDFYLETMIIDEITVVGDIARSRETPVAFTNILPAKIDEELASQDIPMILNSTPGVYATQQGGGDGDARITIRGFNQRNVAVMLDGIPVNDMENGWVYWSNWFGLDAVTRTIQIQRGLGASKLAIPSVGGTLNIITKGIEAKKGGNIKQEIGNDGFLRTSFGYTSGKLKNDWGFTLAGSYKQGDGWVEQNWTKGYFYFLRIDKKLGKHILSATAMGAPQSHGQRSYKSQIATYDKDFADDLIGSDTNYTEPTALDMGLDYNEHWGYLERWTLDENGDTIHANREKVNTKVNYYHKPQFSFKDLWSINDKLYISNILYVSIGQGGGTGLSGSVNHLNNQVHLQELYNNQYDTAINEEQISTGMIYSSRNNHYWYGFLSTISYDLSEELNLSGGIDLRSYRGEHFREVYDLLGGVVYYDEDGRFLNNNNTPNTARVEGDKILYHNDGLVRWGGLFAQAEYKTGNWSGFVSLSASNSGYKRIDYFAEKDIVLADTILFQAAGYKRVGPNIFLPDTVHYNGNSYTVNSPEARHSETIWKWIPGFTFKSGANYNLNEYNNIFINLGYLSKATRFNNVIGQDNKLLNKIDNELVKAIELGYAYKSNKFTINLNTYYTNWENKPVQPFTNRLNYDTLLTGYISGINAIHKGIELDFVWKIFSNLELQGLFSLGDWKWDSHAEITRFDESGEFYDNYTFNANNVHVGDAAQTQYAFSIRYEPLKKLYLKGKYTHFTRYYADFNPEILKDLDEPRDSWELPSYKLVDFHAGYRFNIFGQNMSFSFNILNALNETYISDALDNDSYISDNPDEFDAKSASVFFGLGRRYTTSLKISF